MWFLKFTPKEQAWLRKVLKKSTGKESGTYEYEARRYLHKKRISFKAIATPPSSPSLAPVMVPPEELLKGLPLEL